MITSTTTDFTFRKVDLSLHPDLKVPFTPVDMKLGNPVKQVTGHSKAAQNYLRALMTPLGHYRSRPSFGSEFSTQLFAGSMIFLEDLPNIFAVESLRVIENLFDVKDDSYPDDEVVIRAELDSFDVRPGLVQLVIYLYYRNETEPKSIRLPIVLDQAA